jgi:hypothetical protein
MLLTPELLVVADRDGDGDENEAEPAAQIGFHAWTSSTGATA